MTTDVNVLLAQHLARVPVHRALIRTLETRLFAGEPLVRPVLDIGCGDGHYAAVTFPGGIEVGIDITETIVAEARRHGPYERLEVADGTHLPFDDGSFVTVVSNCVIEHIPDIEALVSEVERVLRPGGRFIFSVPSEYFTTMLCTVGVMRCIRLGALGDLYGRWWNAHAAHHHLDSPVVWQERLARHNFTVEKHIYYMSEPATHVFEASHYFAIPSIIWHKFTGRWSLRPGAVRNSIAYRWLHPYAAEPWPKTGSCAFFVARKV